MAIAISCQHCGQRYSVDDRAAGKTVTCQGCRRQFIAHPEPSDELGLAPEPEPEQRQVPRQPATPAPVAQPAPAYVPGPLDLSDMLDDNIVLGKRKDDEEAAPKKKRKKIRLSSSSETMSGMQRDRLREFRGSCHFLGGIHIFFALICLAAVGAVSEGARMAEKNGAVPPAEMAAFRSTVQTTTMTYSCFGAAHLIAGVGLCLKQMWGVWISLTICYINAFLFAIQAFLPPYGTGGYMIGKLIGIGIGAATNGGMAMKGHTILSLALSLRNDNIPLNTKI